MEFIVTMVRCLRKGLLEPNEPLIMEACKQIEAYYQDGYIDKELFRDITDMLYDDFGVIYPFTFDKKVSQN